MQSVGEQRRIVAAIEDALALLGEAVAEVEAARDKAAAVLPIALQGLFDREWPKRTIGEIARVGSGATPKRSEARYWTDGTVPWVTSGGVHSRRIASPSELITEDALTETSVRLWPPGTVLVAMYGEGKTRGRAARLDFESTCNQACAAIDFDRSVVDGDYLMTFLNSQYEANRRLAAGGVQPNLSLGLVKSMEIPLPALSTQVQVAERAEQIVLAIGRLSDECSRVARRANALGRSVLNAAFSGRLSESQSPLVTSPTEVHA